MTLHEHFSALDTDEDKTEEDLLASALGVIGYARQSIYFHPDRTDKFLDYLSHESYRIKTKARLPQYPLLRNVT